MSPFIRCDMSGVRPAIDFRDPRPDDLSSLECAFVDGKIFLKTHFVTNGDLQVEVDQRPTRCQNEYRTRLRPFLSPLNGGLFGVEFRFRSRTSTS